MFDKNHNRVQNLTELNTALFALDPQITGIDSSMLETPGANMAMLNAVITADPFNLYDTLTRGQLLMHMKVPLAALVNTHPIQFQYDTHGDKHFPGGPAGTKFNAGGGVQATQTSINPLLVQLIAPYVGRIRRDANGRVQTYYLTDSSKPYTMNGPNLCIQVDYVPQPESISYHGYPDSVAVATLSRVKGGAAIPR